MPIYVTPDLLTQYACKTLVHDAHEETCKMYHDLKIHANGEMPYELIECRRPSESINIKEYREKIYQPVTKSTFTKVISSLAKIRRSPDWSIEFPDTKASAIAEDETLEKYMSEKYPYAFSSLTNWMFSVGIKNYLIDANAVILVIPINLDKIDDAEYYKPFPFVFNSPRVLAFEHDDYCVLISETTCRYNVTDREGSVLSQQNDGVIMHIVTDEYIETFHQVDANKRMKSVRYYEHGLGYLPAIKMPGAFFSSCGTAFINESRIAGMLPDMNEACRQYSDLQAEIVQHVHSEKWIFQNTDCDVCSGTGREQVNLNTVDTCHKCHGVGKVPTSPYSNHVLRPPEMGEQAIPTPPAGYIQKSDVALMVTKQNDMVNEKLYNALAAINMQFLSTVPLAQSGVAKEVDKEELNNFVHGIAEDLVSIMDFITMCTADMRYSVVLSDNAKRAALLPDIAVPAVFDLLSSTYLVDEIKTAKESKISTLIIMALEAEYAAKKFYNNPEVAQLLTLTFALDPMPGVDDDQKAIRLQNEGITQEDYIISCNIVPFIKRAIRENKRFVALDYEAQMQILEEYAAEKMPDTATRITPPADVPVVQTIAA